MWDVLLLISIVYQGISLPLKVSFEIDTTDFMFILDFTIDVMFIADIVLNFNTGFYTKNQLVMKRFPIAKDYLKQWFWVDLISSIPYTWIFSYA